MSPGKLLAAGLAGALCASLLGAGSLRGSGLPAARSGDLPSFVPGFEATVESAIALAIDAGDRVWALTEEPPAFVRLDESGAVAERVPFAWPEGLSGSCVGVCPFVISGSGDFIVSRHRFDRRGRRIANHDFNQSWDMAAGPGDTVVLLAGDGLEVFDRQGRSVRRFSEGGVAPGKLEDPRALVVDRRGRALVAEKDRFQVFGRTGRFLRAVRLPAELRTEDTWIKDLALDSRGFLYVRLANSPARLAVFDRELRYLGAPGLPDTWPSEQIAVDRKGRLYSLFDRGRVQQVVPVGRSLRAAKPLTGAPEPAGAAPPVRSMPGVPVTASLEDSAPRPFRLHTGTRNVRDLAADPRVPGRLWLATDGGLVRYDPGAESWRKWTLADGLPDGEVRSVFSDGRRVFLLLKDGAAVFDPETERFSRLALRGESGIRLGGVRIDPDPRQPGVSWWLAVDGVVRHDAAADTWLFFRAPGPVRDGAVLPGPAERLAVLTGTEILELRPREGVWRRLCDLDDLDRAAPDRPFASTKLRPDTLSASPDGRSLWIGFWATGFLFHLDLESGKVSRPAWTRDLRCSSMHLVSHRSRTFLAGDDCFREIDFRETAEACCCVDVPATGEVRRVIADPGLPDLLWIATDQGLASFHLENGRFGRHRPPVSEPDGGWASGIFPAEGRLWVAFPNAALGVLDPASGRWKVFPDLQSVQLIRRSAANGLLLVHGTFRQGTGELAWLDPRTQEQGSAHAGWRSVWWSLNDLYHDENGLWGTGALEGKDSSGFGLLRPDGTRQIWAEGSSRPVRFVADPRHRGDFWMIRDDGEGKALVRFRAAAGDWEVLRPSIYDLELTGDRWLWGLGSPNVRYDLETGTLTELGLTGEIFPDPEDPGRAWSLDGDRLQLCDLSTGERLADLPLPFGDLYEDPVLLGDRLWLATGFGLLEAPLEALRGPEGASPAHCTGWRGVDRGD